MTDRMTDIILAALLILLVVFGAVLCTVFIVDLIDGGIDDGCYTRRVDDGYITKCR